MKATPVLLAMVGALLCHPAGVTPARAQEGDAQLGGAGPATPLVGTLWRLAELGGRPVAVADAEATPTLVLSAEGNRLEGFGGCNSFSASFEREGRNGIRFADFATTLMACPAMETEAALLQALQVADGYALGGGRLLLYRASMPPLAVFEAAPAH